MMQKHSLSFFWIGFIIVLLFSCQQEVHFPKTILPAATNRLQTGSNGACQPIKVAGTYYKNKPLRDSNFLEVQVAVKATGPFRITTQTVNGYSFEGSGTFSDTGLVRVQLAGSGQPMEPGQDTFVVSYGETSCTAIVTVGIAVVSPASFTLVGSPQACFDASVSGAYIKNIGLDYTCVVVLQVDVSSPGPYQVRTDTVNGYSFSGSGFLSQTGTQTITLIGHGTPQQEGTDVFTLAGGISSCTFAVSVSSGFEVVTGSDYFPLTFGSNWVYTDVRNSGTNIKYNVKRSVSDSTLLNGETYKVVAEDNPVEGANQHLYRKDGGSYYERVRVDQYNSAVKFNESIIEDVLFLKEKVPAGTFWESGEYRGTILGGQTIILKYYFVCLSTNETETIQGKTYTDVIKIKRQPFLRPLDQDFSVGGEYTELHYAKGVGLIYTKNIVSVFTKMHWELNSYSIK